MSFDHTTALKEIANGDQDAELCLNTLFSWFHALDDLIDRDKPLLLPWTIMSHLRALECVANNPFFQKHKLALLPVLEAASLAFLESERFKLHESPLYRIGSQVLKSQYQDLFYTVARRTGGEEFMVRMSEKYRDFDFDPVPKP
jgi:hypothetical protein